MKNEFQRKENVITLTQSTNKLITRAIDYVESTLEVDLSKVGILDDLNAILLLNRLTLKELKEKT